MPTVMERTYYELLSVPAQASPEALARAWKIAARRNHPDRWRECGFESEQQANAHMAAINQAYQVLRDPRTRRLYDLERGLLPARCGRCGNPGALRDGGNGTIIPLCDTCLAGTGTGTVAARVWQQ